MWKLKYYNDMNDQCVLLRILCYSVINMSVLHAWIYVIKIGLWWCGEGHIWASHGSELGCDIPYMKKH